MWMVVVALAMTGCPPPAPPITYHNNASRTGWAGLEGTLTPANVTRSTFGLIAHTELDGQVDAQPLVALRRRIAGGTHDVAYVVTSRNTVYAIDARSGVVLNRVNLGPPVPMPLQCNNNDATVGITSTPLLDVDNRALYVMAYVLPSPNAAPIYQLHALDPATLADRAGSPVTVTASHVLTDHTVRRFDASVQRQRPALLYANGNIYAGFGSFCDYSPEASRGWVLGWKASTLAPLARNVLLDRLGPTPAYTLWDGTTHQPFYLAAVWMSGFGLAADEHGDVYFVTGNGNGLTYDGSASLQESAVKVSRDLSTVLDYFTPSNAVTPPDGLDPTDNDFGSGGLMVLPAQPGRVPHLAVAAGKDGRMFLLDRDNMGKFHNPDRPASVDIGGCWCGPSYFLGADGIGRVVTSGGNQVKTWKVNTAGTPTLVLEATSPALDSGQDPGFFTTVSSGLTAAGTQIIWAVGRPTGAAHRITLYAISGTPVGGTLPLLWSGVAGSWPNTGGNANLVPTVVAGKVYVASYRELAIFGLLPGGRAGISPEGLIHDVPPEDQPPGATIWGTVREVGERTLVIQLRDGKLLSVDLTPAQRAGAIYLPKVGGYAAVRGALNDRGVLEASAISRAKSPASWGVDKLR
ncbi:MAG TPA: hypothetical protein VF516_00415 [Kofleriaceae bacterium]